MKLPNSKQAFVPRSKLKDYLLSKTHAGGRAKAKFFRKYGFDESNVDLLEKALIAIAQKQDVVEVVSSSHGEKYVVDGALNTPFNRLIKIKTVWIIEKGQEEPRFITAYPA